MKVIIIIAIILGIISYIVITGNNINLVQDTGGEVSPPYSVKNKTLKNITPVIPTAIKSDPGIPKRIQIPSINVDASIEEVGLDDQNNMDVPKNIDNAAWYSPGYKPGDLGNAALAGHYDKASGEPAVFWDIINLNTGDKIIITDSKNQNYTFLVSRIQNYPYDNFPLNETFGTSDYPMLNLITCNGEWDEGTQNYSLRTVVYSELEN